jgi:hypothetical protein
VVNHARKPPRHGPVRDVVGILRGVIEERCCGRATTLFASLTELAAGRFATAEDAIRHAAATSIRMQRSKNGDLFCRLLPRRTAVAPQLKADPRIGIGAKHLARLDDRAVPVRQSRGGVLRAGLRDRRGCHKSGKGDGGQQNP